jgi:hypothetical protein
MGLYRRRAVARCWSGRVAVAILVAGLVGPQYECAGGVVATAAQRVVPAAGGEAALCLVAFKVGALRRRLRDHPLMHRCR